MINKGCKYQKSITKGQQTKIFQNNITNDYNTGDHQVDEEKQKYSP